MQRIKIKRGLNLPITGAPKQQIGDAGRVGTVAVLGPDYVGMKPTMAVGVGDRVKLGQVLFSDKRAPGVVFTSPGCGKVIAVNRGAKRALQSVVVELAGDEAEQFAKYDEAAFEDLDAEKVKENLVRSGLWTAIRTRPFSKVPPPESTPHSIFVTAMDTNPLAADPSVVIAERPEDFVRGLKVLSRLTPEKVFVCKAPDAAVPGGELSYVVTTEFAGPHPAGLAGTHIHFLDPVGKEKTVWYLNYQDVMAIGSLLVSGRLNPERVLSLAGPAVKNPRLIRTRLGASTDDLVQGELVEGENRVVSGPVIAGHQAAGPLAFLGRYHLQVSALAEGRQREFFGWLGPGFKRFSVTNTMASCLSPEAKYPMNTAAFGRRRAIVPIGAYEKVMPLDILPTFLFRALETNDVEQAEALGCLELDEDDVALCTFVCPGKIDFGPMLRRNLTTIEKEG
ncbi:MAG TPA: Na(+)-translocating NADH-quinone reductase subunit A [Thermoguttaceae bacterium]|nr:Na(+)-translocating NADH-quinone reductase subunit A [Thermoguttaceae bacterium]